MLVDKREGIGTHLAAHVEQVVVVALHLCADETVVGRKGKIAVREEYLIICPADRVGGPVVFLHQFQIVGHERTLGRTFQMLALEHELAVFDMTICNRHRKAGVGLADDAHRISVGQIDLSMNDKTHLLGLHGMEAQKKGQ